MNGRRAAAGAGPARLRDGAGDQPRASAWRCTCGCGGAGCDLVPQRARLVGASAAGASRPVLHIGLPGAAENIAWRLAMMITVAMVAGMGVAAARRADLHAADPAFRDAVRRGGRLRQRDPGRPPDRRRPPARGRPAGAQEHALGPADRHRRRRCWPRWPGPGCCRCSPATRTSSPGRDAAVDRRGAGARARLQPGGDQRAARHRRRALPGGRGQRLDAAS